MQTLEIGTVPPNVFALFVDWCHALIESKFGVEGEGQSSGRFSIKPNGGPEISLIRDGSGKCSIESAESLQPEVLEIMQEAKNKSAQGDFGLSQWWQTELTSRSDIDPTFGLHMMRMMGHAGRYNGRFRLGEDALAECSVDAQTGVSAFLKQTIKLKFRSPGPGYGPQALALAQKQASLIRVVLGFCTAGILDGGIFVKPYRAPDAQPGAGILASIEELCRHNVPVWTRIHQTLPSSENHELANRMINALTAYEHAQHQATDGAAILFYIAAIEALTVPNNSYANERVRSRFKAILRHLAESKLVETLAHPNFATAFACSKLPTNPNQLTEHLYGIRSKFVHSGAFGLDRDIFFGMTSIGPPMRVALIAEIAERAILEFLQAPYSSLIGHPDFDDDWQLKLTKEQRAVIAAAAQESGVRIREYMHQALKLTPES